LPESNSNSDNTTTPKKTSPAHPTLVLGAGVAGLTTALVLARRGHKVHVVAERFSAPITSFVAGALWEWPPAICGHHHNPQSLARSKIWAAESYKVFAKLAPIPDSGVFLRRANFYFKQPLASTPTQLQKMNELRTTVQQFQHDPTLAHRNGIAPDQGIHDAYSFLAPMVDTDAYLIWLRNQAAQLGCSFEQRRIEGPLHPQCHTLAQNANAVAVVNCTGLGAAQLADDAIVPLRGALVRYKNGRPDSPLISESHCLAPDETKPKNGFVFIVPRGHTHILLGGFAEPNEFSLQIGLQNHPPIQAIVERCHQFLPALRDAELDSLEPVRVGLRPTRAAGVRLESDPLQPILIHNYGHGGSGVTLSWGCANEVATLIDQRVANS
jgi:D-amino-acid oxidase